jgi:lysozyme
MNKWAKTAAATGSAGVIAATVVFLPQWEGMDSVAKRDMIGTGHPVTYCYGQTDEFGQVRVGTRFTKQECDQKLAESLPRYLAKIEPCIKVPLPGKTKAALLDAAYNAGPGAVCKSPMVRLMNAGKIKEGCNAFAGWYVRSDGKVRRGLVARRGGDSRKGEKQLCLEGIQEALNDPKPLTPAEFKADPYACFGAGRDEAMSEGRQCPVSKKAWWQK